MMTLLRALGSMHLALLGLAGVLVALVAGSLAQGPPPPWFGAALMVLAVNLVAAVMVRPQFRRQPALLVFHVCLAALAGLFAVHSMTRFEGRVELAENQAFDAAAVEVHERGRWHRDTLGNVAFTQGPLSIEYLPDLRRGKTRSLVFTDGGAKNFQRLGDAQSLHADGYRFTVTPNKGFALTLSWLDDDGYLLTGNIHFPSYPAREWEQERGWMTPSEEVVRFSLALDPAPVDRTWVLDGDTFDGRVWMVDPSGRREELHVGVPVEVPGGRIRLEDVVLWMGYRVESQGILNWIFVTALLGLAALGGHFLRRPERYRSTGRRAHAA